MRCPECQAELSEERYEGMRIFACRSCGGEFVGAEELMRIIETREERFDPQLLEELADREPVYGVPSDSVDRQVICPACENPMGVVNYAGDSEVLVDKCGACGGVWLDHEELEKVQILMEKWQDAAPAKIQEIAGELEEARRLAAQQTQRAFEGSRFSFVNALINRVLDAA